MGSTFFREVRSTLLSYLRPFIIFSLFIVDVEEVAYVFDNVIVSYPPPLDETNFGISSLWLEVRNPDAHKYSQMIGNRFEHTAVISQEGSMFIWGGQFQDTVNVKGIWMLNIAGKDSEVRLTLAENDRNFDDYEATLTALHT